MGINDAREQLEVCKDEYGKLERENAELRARDEGRQSRIRELLIEGDKLRAQVAELQAVIERAEDYVTCHYLDTAMGESVLAILTRVSADKGGGQ